MLTYAQKYKMSQHIKKYYYEYAEKFHELRLEYEKNSVDYKYSVGGEIHPYGKYFVSKIAENERKQTTGRFCKNREKANFIYGFSEDKKLISICRILKDTLMIPSVYLSFLVYQKDYIAVLTYHQIYSDMPLLTDVGAIYLTDDREYIINSHSMLTVSAYIKDKTKKCEYAYHFQMKPSEPDKISSEEIDPHYSKLDIK